MSKTQAHKSRRRSRQQISVAGLVFGGLDFSEGLTLFEIQTILKARKMELPVSYLNRSLEEAVELGYLQPVAELGGSTAWEVAN